MIPPGLRIVRLVLLDEWREVPLHPLNKLKVVLVLSLHQFLSLSNLKFTSITLTIPSLSKAICRTLKLCKKSTSRQAFHLTLLSGTFSGQAESRIWQQTLPEPNCSILVSCSARSWLIQSSISCLEVKQPLLIMNVSFINIIYAALSQSFIIAPLPWCQLSIRERVGWRCFDDSQAGDVSFSIILLQIQIIYKQLIRIAMAEKPKEMVVSKSTKEKVEAAKNFIEQRYSKMIQQEQQKKEYWEQLNQKMQALGMSQNEQKEIKKQISHEQALQLREERKKITIFDFKAIKIIGKGAFGEVRLCKWNKSNDPVAVKKLKKCEMIFKNKVMQSRQERNVLAISEKNPWVVGLKCSFQDNDNLYLVMEYLPGGDLMNLLMKKDIFTHEEAQFYTAEILMALDSVHKMKYIHRDLKPDNVLLDANGHIKLSDFGLCKHTEIKPKRLLDNLVKKQDLQFQKQAEKAQFGKDFHKRNRKLAYSAVGTPDYVAPQVQGKLGYTETVDWWSMGVILFEMLVGYPPFASETPRETWFKIQNWRKYLQIPSDAKVSIQAVDLIRKLVADPRERLGINGVEEIKAHPFFTGINWSKLRERRSPYIPEVKNSWDTQNFDPYEEQEPWFPSQSKSLKSKKKNPQFIGYTYKPMQESNSALVRALIDLDSYKGQSVRQDNNSLEYLQLQRNNDYQLNSLNLFKKKQDKTERISKEFYVSSATSSAITSMKKTEDKEKERYKFYYADTPEKKPSPAQNFYRKSPKQSPKQSSKQSPSSKGVVEQKKMKMKVLQKKLI